MKEVTKYMAEDGKIFDSEIECKNYENTLGTEYEVSFRVNAILRLDGIIVKRKIRTNVKPSYDYCSDFKDIAFDAIMDTDVSESAGELLGIAANQDIYPYFDCFEDEQMIEYKKIE